MPLALEPLIGSVLQAAVIMTTTPAAAIPSNALERLDRGALRGDKTDSPPEEEAVELDENLFECIKCVRITYYYKHICSGFAC
jgi:hypothetical protein